MNPIVQRINELRAKKGMSQNELANLIGVSANAVYHWNKRGAMPSLSNIEKICEVMGITIEQFFYGIDDRDEVSDDKKFLYEWQSLSSEEKAAIIKVMEAFCAISKESKAE